MLRDCEHERVSKWNRKRVDCQQLQLYKIVNYQKKMIAYAFALAQ